MLADSISGFLEWVNRLDAGDPAAFQLLAEHACHRLCRVVHRIQHGDFGPAAWDASGLHLAEPLADLQLALQTLRPPTARRCLGLTAEHLHRRLGELVPPPTEPPLNGAAADATTRSYSRWTDFHRHVAELSPQDREVFDLLFYVGLVPEEAASVLRMPLSAVRRRWLSARLRLGSAVRGRFNRVLPDSEGEHRP